MVNKLGIKVPQELVELAENDLQLQLKVNYLRNPKQYLKCLKCANRDNYYDICKYSGYECRNVNLCSSFKKNLKPVTLPKTPSFNFYGIALTASELPSQGVQDGYIVLIPIKSAKDDKDEDESINRYEMYVYCNGWHKMNEITYPPVTQSN